MESTRLVDRSQDFPGFLMNDEKSVFTLRFPKFNNQAKYDPVITSVVDALDDSTSQQQQQQIENVTTTNVIINERFIDVIVFGNISMRYVIILSSCLIVLAVAGCLYWKCWRNKYDGYDGLGGNF